MSIYFSSRTQNTKTLAQALAAGLGLACYDLKDSYPLPGDESLFFFGFWVDKGDMDEVAKAALASFKGKKIALFYSAGIDPEHEHVQNMNAQFKELSHAAGALVMDSVFMSQGKIAQDVIDMQRAMAAQYPDNPKLQITPEKEARWQRASRHPDEKDCASLVAWAKGLLG